jgi:RNA polymerase sigma factor (sigma-70 family)
VDTAIERLVGQSVRARFVVATEEFITRLRDLARDAGHVSAPAQHDYLARLSLDDLYLAQACLAKDESAWRELATAHFEFMRAFARRFLPADAAREVADEVIADLWERGKLRQYGGRSTLRTWLGTVVTHAALNTRPALARAQSLDVGGAEVAGEDTADTGAAERESASLMARFLGEALRELSAEDRLLLYMYYEQHLTLDELGVLLRTSAPAVSRRLKRTRDDLLAALESRARRATGESASELRRGLDLSQIELNLDKLLGSPLSKGREA